MQQYKGQIQKKTIEEYKAEMQNQYKQIQNSKYEMKKKMHKIDKHVEKHHSELTEEEQSILGKINKEKEHMGEDIREQENVMKEQM